MVWLGLAGAGRCWPVLAVALLSFLAQHQKAPAPLSATCHSCQFYPVLPPTPTCGVHGWACEFLLCFQFPQAVPVRSVFLLSSRAVKGEQETHSFILYIQHHIHYTNRRSFTEAHEAGLSTDPQHHHRYPRLLFVCAVCRPFILLQSLLGIHTPDPTLRVCDQEDLRQAEQPLQPGIRRQIIVLSQAVSTVELLSDFGRPPSPESGRQSPAFSSSCSGRETVCFTVDTTSDPRLQGGTGSRSIDQIVT